MMQMLHSIFQYISARRQSNQVELGTKKQLISENLICFTGFRFFFNLEKRPREIVLYIMSDLLQ